MKDVNGKEMTEEDKIISALELLSDAVCILFETEEKDSHALAFMVDNALKYGQVILREGNILLAAADYTKYEDTVYRQEKALKELS